MGTSELIPGEGLGVAVVETAEHAASRGVCPYAELHDIDISPDPGDAPLFITSAYTGEFWSTGILGVALALGRLAREGDDRFVVAFGNGRGHAASTITFRIGEDFRR
jgi:hypothetical protein